MRGFSIDWNVVEQIGSFLVVALKGRAHNERSSECEVCELQKESQLLSGINARASVSPLAQK